jgi:hypothetical protein
MHIIPSKGFMVRKADQLPFPYLQLVIEPMPPRDLWS